MFSAFQVGKTSTEILVTFDELDTVYFFNDNSNPFDTVTDVGTCPTLLSLLSVDRSKYCIQITCQKFRNTVHTVFQWISLSIRGWYELFDEKGNSLTVDIVIKKSS